MNNSCCRWQRLSISSTLLQLIDLPMNHIMIPMNFIIMMRMTSTLLVLQQQLQDHRKKKQPQKSIMCPRRSSHVSAA
ncbi:hypothetical protein BDL97_10G024000 [Sphagnum fallax]|nr:hypothetical protein BDL97_10G024000 [Sphagnum fallax]